MAHQTKKLTNSGTQYQNIFSIKLFFNEPNELLIKILNKHHNECLSKLEFLANFLKLRTGDLMNFF